MNGIQGCVYIVRKAPVTPIIADDEDKPSVRTKWNTYRTEGAEIRQASAPFCKAANQHRADSPLKLRPYAYRSVTDDDNGVRELINNFLGNDSVVLLDAEHLPYVRSVLVENGTISDHQSAVLLYDTGGLKDLALFQGASLLSN